MTGSEEFSVVNVAEIPPVHVGEGCTRRDLPSRDGVRIWVVDMAPGAEWPHVDRHDAFGEDIYVAEGVLIEGGRSVEAGSFVRFNPNSAHRPRTDVGVRLFGFNLAARADV